MHHSVSLEDSTSFKNVIQRLSTIVFASWDGMPYSFVFVSKLGTVYMTDLFERRRTPRCNTQKR